MIPGATGQRAEADTHTSRARSLDPKLTSDVQMLAKR